MQVLPNYEDYEDSQLAIINQSDIVYTVNQSSSVCCSTGDKPGICSQ